MCRGEGRRTRSGLFAETDGIVQFHLSGTDDAFRMGQSTKLMIHFARSWAKECGNRVLLLGGGVGGTTDPLLLFKGGFSPLRSTFATLRMVIDETEHSRLVAARDPLLNPNVLDAFFPMYRYM